jgi:hypothetical protein
MNKSESNSNKSVISTEDDNAKLANATKAEKQVLFLAYCQRVIIACKHGTIDIHEAGYSIACCMFLFESLGDDPLFEEITNTAGTLELPRGISTESPAELWTKLQSLVKEYQAQLSA